MGIRRLLGRHASGDVMSAKILVASLGSKFSELIETDNSTYRHLNLSPTNAVFKSIDELFAAIAKRYDVVHLFCDVSHDGTLSDIEGKKTSGTTLIQKCFESGVKLLWLAANNEPEGYITGFKLAAGTAMNLVLTIDRRGSRFSSFLAELLLKMSHGESMPLAWVSLAPQSSKDPRNQEAPSCIYVAGRSAPRLR